MITLDLSIKTNGVNSLLEFNGIITIEEFKTLPVTINFIAKINKGRLQSIDLTRDEKFGSIPPALSVEIKRLVLLSIKEYKVLGNKKPEQENPTSGFSANKSFKIQENEWLNFINPTKTPKVISPQRNKALLAVAM